MEDKYAILRESLIVIKPKRIVKWLASDGKSFNNIRILKSYEAYLRAVNYNEALKKRNWLQKLFNIKPDIRLC